MGVVIATGFIRRAALNFSILIDLPDKSRKFHQRPTPLIGGFGILSGLIMGIILFLLIGDYAVNNNKELNYQTSIQILEKDEVAIFDIDLVLGGI